jgi:hypothetical protein
MLDGCCICFDATWLLSRLPYATAVAAAAAANLFVTADASPDLLLLLSGIAGDDWPCLSTTQYHMK